MIIHTVLKTNQMLSPMVLDGIHKNGCTVKTEYSDESDRFEHLVKAWGEHFRNHKVGVFVALDADLVIEPKMVEELLYGLKDMDFVMYSNRANTYSLEFPNDSFWACKPECLSLPIVYVENECPICNWIKRLMKKFNVGYLPNKRIMDTAKPIDIK